MSENMVTTGFFGFGDGKGHTQTGVPEGVQAATAAILAGAIPQFEKVTFEGVKSMYFMFEPNRKPKVMTLTLTNTGGSSTIAKIQGEMEKLEMSEVFSKLKSNAPDSEVCALIDELHKDYARKCDANNIQDARNTLTVPEIDLLISNCKLAGIEPSVTNKIRDIRDLFVEMSKKKQQNRESGELTEVGPQMVRHGELTEA